MHVSSICLIARGLLELGIERMRAIMQADKGPPIVDPGGGNVGVAEPLLDLGDVGVVIEGVGSGRGAEPVRADLEA